MSTLLNWAVHHGYLGMFGLLAAGVLALPVPEDTVLVVAGCLVAGGQWSLLPTWGFAVAGGAAGITSSYLLGCALGSVVLNRLVIALA
jgi:membrane protein DedA with SNARE-associated domain